MYTLGVVSSSAQVMLLIVVISQYKNTHEDYLSLNFIGVLISSADSRG